MSVVQNSGMQGTNVVIDISNINPSEVLENVIKLYRDSYRDVNYRSQRSVIDMDVSNNYDVSYSFQIFTTYASPNTSSLNVKYINGIVYTSAVIPFRVEPYKAPEVIKNGTFSFPTDIQPEFIKGVTRDIPSPWFGELCLLSENVNSSTNISVKYLNIPEVSNHVILYNPKPGTATFPRLYQEFPFLFKDYYKLNFYVANHVPAGSPFAYSTSSKTIKYQIKLIADDIVLFETSPIPSNESSWNKFEILFYFPFSYKNVTFAIQRTKNEFNNLFVTDISLTGIGQIFDTSSPHTTFIENEWVLPRETQVNSWKGIMPEGNIVGNVYSLSSNMTIGFCLYIHNDNNSSSEYKGIFDLAGHPSIYFKENTLKIDNDGVTRIQTVSGLKIPIYYHVTFDQNYICLYINGEFESSIGSSDFFTEASPEDLIFIGTPEVKTRGYLMNDLKMYDFPLQKSQIRELFKSLDYSQIGNSSDLTGHFVTVGMGTSSFFQEDVSFSLNNGQVLSNKIILYTPLMKDVSFNSTSTKSSYSVTLTFWGRNLNGKMSFKNDNNQSLLDITCDSTQIIPSLNTSLAIPRNSNDLQHYSWTFDISGESKSYLNGYMYDASINEKITTNLFTDCSCISFNLSETSEIGEFKIFDKTLSPTEILTNYYNYYSISSTYNYQSGIYIVTINAPENVAYSIEKNNKVTIGYGRDNVDISMSAIDLNSFHKSKGIIKFTLTEYNIFTNIYGSGNPYVTVEDLSDNEITDISENTTFQVKLHNAPKNDEYYAFTIAGSVDTKDFSGGTSGSIMNQIPIQITMKKDYKTEGTEPLIFSIADLKIGTSVNVLDTTKNMLSTDPYPYYRTGEVFVVSLQIPIDEKDLDDVLDISYELIDCDGFANRVDNETALTFHRESTNIHTIDISFIAITPEASRVFTLKLLEYESSVEVVINDILRPELILSKTSVNEGDSVILTLKSPLSWNGFHVPFFIIKNPTNGINSEDVSCDDLNYSQTDMSGVFVVQDASSSLVFAINPNNSYSEGRETLTFCLSEYSDISASVFIIDTSMPVSCRWEITDLTDNVISTINEGESFKVSLITKGIADTTDVSYTITGIVPVDLLGSQDTTGVFNVSNNTRQFSILNDLSTDGSKYMVFTTNFNDPLILDVSASIFINDTSQSPDYQVTSNVVSPQNGSSFIISFKIANYSFLTETQKNEQLSYTATLQNPSGIHNKISGPLQGRIISSNGTLTQSGMIHSFVYTLKTSEQNTFIFTMGGKSLQVNLNSTN